VWYLLKSAQVKRQFSSQKIAGKSNMTLDLVRYNRLYFSTVYAVAKTPHSKMDRPHISICTTLTECPISNKWRNRGGQKYWPSSSPDFNRLHILFWYYANYWTVVLKAASVAELKGITSEDAPTACEAKLQRTS
jgi:hypothetical protein